MIPRGGGDRHNAENLQLPCILCNGVKGDPPKSYVVDKPREPGISAYTGA